MKRKQRPAQTTSMASGKCPEKDCGAGCHPVEMDLKAVVRLVVERLQGDVLFDPQTAEERVHHQYATQAIAWLRKAVT